MTPGDVGILKSTLLPSFGIYSSLSLATYLAAEATNRVELKDWLWPSAQVLNAWWSAIGQHMYKENLPLSTVWEALPWTERVLLSCVTIWGTRLFARIASRSLTRGKDDSRYEAVKKEPGFWKSAFVKIFLPEALVLSFISLPFTIPFNGGDTTLALGENALNLVRGLGVGLFGAGFAMEVLADTQLELHRRERADLCRHGVWGLVRHPKYVLSRQICDSGVGHLLMNRSYLGDTLVHFSFTLLNMAGFWNPIVLLGPIANYLFLRVVGGDKQTEASQEERYKYQDSHKYEQLKQWQKENNSFWPGLRDLVNPWALAVAGCGFIAVVVEEALRGTFDM
jgi:steroid 5-alpha reductase family enzyme